MEKLKPKFIEYDWKEGFTFKKKKKKRATGDKKCLNSAIQAKTD